MDLPVAHSFKKSAFTKKHILSSPKIHIENLHHLLTLLRTLSRKEKRSNSHIHNIIEQAFHYTLQLIPSLPEVRKSVNLQQIRIKLPILPNSNHEV